MSDIDDDQLAERWLEAEERAIGALVDELAAKNRRIVDLEAALEAAAKDVRELRDQMGAAGRGGAQ